MVAKLETLVDAFATNQAATLWTGSFPTTAATSNPNISGGVATVTASAATAGLDTGATLYDGTNSYIYAKITPTNSAGVTVRASLLLQNNITTGSDVRATWDESGTITFGQRTGSFTTVGTNGTKASTSGTAYWVAIAEGTARAKFDGTAGVPGNLYEFWSPDGVTWTLQATSVTPAWFATSVKVQLLAQTASGSVSVAFDNVNANGTLLTLSPPTAPTSFTAVRSSVDPTQATLTWGPPVSNGGTTVSSYSVTRDGVDNTGFGAFTSPAQSSTASSYLFSGLTGTAYHFTVYAANNSGNGTSASATIAASGSVTGLPSASTIVDTFGEAALDTAVWTTTGTAGAVTLTGGALAITPDSSAPGIVSIPVSFLGQSMFVQVPQVSGDTGAQTVMAVQQSTDPTTRMRMYVVNGVLVADNQVAGASDLNSVPYVAANMAAIRIRHDAVLGRVYYEYSTVGETTWNVLRYIPAPAWLGSVQLRLYAYEPAATGGGGGTSAPSAPTSVSASASGTSATVSWQAPASTGGSPITSYTVTRDGIDTSNPGIGAGYTWTLDPTTTSVTANNLQTGSTVNFTVVANNAVGASAAANASVTLASGAAGTVTAGYDWLDEFATFDKVNTWYPCYPYALGGKVDEGSGGSYNAGTGNATNPYSIISDSGASSGNALRVSCKKSSGVAGDPDGGTGWIGGIAISKRGWTSGCVRFRVRYPQAGSGKGMFPALWLFGQTQSGSGTDNNGAYTQTAASRYEEIDLLETFGVPLNWYSTLHTQAPAGGAISNNQYFAGTNDNGWHTYDVKWDGSTYVEIWYDGVLKKRITNAEVANLNGIQMAIRINYSMNAGWFNSSVKSDSSTPSPLFFDVDYVAHYTLANSPV